MCVPDYASVKRVHLKIEESDVGVSSSGWAAV